MDLVADSPPAFVSPIRFAETGAVRFEAVGESAALGAFYDDLGDLFETEIVSVRDFRR